MRTSLALLLLLTACSAQGPAAKRTLTVFAAASLTGAFTTLGEDFETAHPGTTVRFSFGGSSALAQQIIEAAPADLFASASAKNMTQVTDAGDATDPQVFANNVAEIAAGPGSSIDGLEDLATAKVALCDPSVPCGALALKVLGNAHLTVQPVTLGLDVKSTLAFVTSGSVEAAIVYATDVLAAGDKVKGIEIPASVNASTAYSIAHVKGSKNAELAKAFEDYVLSAAGQAALATAGFRKP